jgi:hypothetical protein
MPAVADLAGQRETHVVSRENILQSVLYVSFGVLWENPAVHAGGGKLG